MDKQMLRYHRVVRAGAAFALAATLASAAPAPDWVRFDWVDYAGVDAGPAPRAGEYRNPVLPGFHSDPSVVKVGQDFYLVTSTFGWFPGIPVFHSRDLVHWRQIGSAIDRPGQLDFGTLELSRGVFAPAISHHAGRFYIANTCVDCGGNFLLTARDPAGPWSDPVWLRDVEGIDPSLFFDDDGRAWLVNNRAPAGPTKYEGHRAIWLQQIDLKTLRTTGPARMIVDGGVDLAAKPVWIEGPHLFKRGGRYYLSCAEGGTSVQHSQVIFAAGRVEGPYRPAPPAHQPILTQRDLDPARPDPVTSAGHADLLDIGGDRWWAVFLATRPYRDNLYATGRETFLLPVTWQGGWPTILPKGEAIPSVAKLPPLPPSPHAIPSVRETFAGAQLPREWLMMRNPAGRWWRTGQGLALEPRPVGLGALGNPSFLARRLQHADATMTTRLRLPAGGVTAGLAALQNDAFFLTEAVTKTGSGYRVEVRRRAGTTEPVTGRPVAAATLPLAAGTAIRLRLRLRGGVADFAWAPDRGSWRPVARDVDATNLTTEKAGGFVGTMVGPFAMRD
jgi:xylan 1,4-beta-xylosidase